jgi:hypothetical protein
VSRYLIKYDEGFWQDLKETIDWYDDKSEDLGTKLLDDIWLAEEKLKVNPLAFNKISKSNFRRILLTTFPYKIFFRIEGSNIYIIALIHSSRSNRYIKRRLK